MIYNNNLTILPDTILNGRSLVFPRKLELLVRCFEPKLIDSLDEFLS